MRALVLVLLAPTSSLKFRPSRGALGDVALPNWNTIISCPLKKNRAGSWV